MIQNPPCPNQNHLRQLIEGKLEDDQYEQMLEHIESCQNCRNAIDAIEEPSDPFLNSLSYLTQEAVDRAKDQIDFELEQKRDSKLWTFLDDQLKKNSDAAVLQLPCQLGPYQVHTIIARGGMGEVYQAEHLRLHRPVALKVIRSYRQNDPEIRARFLDEMEIVGQFDHPNLVRAYEAWEERGSLYLVFEFLNGQSLHQMTKQDGIQSASVIREIMRDVLSALEELHRHNLVHCDVKPANIVRLKDGKVKLIDFGLVLRQDTGQAKSGAVGTRNYMSPEQKNRNTPVDARSDIYSAGLVLQFLIRNLADTAKSRSDEFLIDGLTKISMKMTQERPEERYQQVSDARSDLEGLIVQDVKPGSGKIAQVSALTLVLVLFLTGLGLVSNTFRTSGNSNLGSVVVINADQEDIVVFTSLLDGHQINYRVQDVPFFKLPQGYYKVGLANPKRRSAKPERALVEKDTVLKIQVTEPRPEFELVMVKIPAGEFVMGAVDGDPLVKPHELPRRLVKFPRPFYMSAYEITVGQYREFVESTGYVTEAEKSGLGGWKATHATGWGEQANDYLWYSPGYNLSDLMPVTQVSYQDSVAFCEWLSHRDQKKYRLPTEAEWEYACRAGTTGINFFPVEDRDDYCWSA